MALAGLQHDPVAEHVGGLDAEHALPGVIGELRQAPGLVDPRVP